MTGIFALNLISKEPVDTTLAEVVKETVTSTFFLLWTSFEGNPTTARVGDTLKKKY